MPRSRSAEAWDVVVIGGGPAGSTLAARLAGYGFRACLLHKDTSIRQHVGETLPASVNPILEELDLRDAVAESLMPRLPEHLVCWGGNEPRLVPQVPGSGPGGYHVWRAPFDELLRDAAKRRGVEMLAGAATSVTLRQSAPAEVVLRRRGRERKLTARMVADCSGRAGVLGRRFRVRPNEFRTLALTGHFSTLETEPGTLVESFRAGWLWTAPTRTGLRDVTVMLDQQAARGDRAALFRSALAQARHVAGILGDARLEGPVRGCDATPFSSRRFAGRDFVLVGDAASTIDPLTAQGVHKAMDSALAAAVVVHTILERPERASDAVEFYQRREETLIEMTWERVRDFYRQETRWAGEPFWRKRSSGVKPLEPRLVRPLAAESRLRPAPGVRLVEGPVLEGDFIERREVLVGPTEARGVRFLGGVCLTDLWKRAAAAGSVAEAARGFPGSEREARWGIDWLYRQAFLDEA